MAGSLSVGVYEGDKQVAYGRIVTDRATFAWVCDVFVDTTVRGRGIGSWLMQAVVEHLQGLGVYRIMLATHDAHEMYAKVGFTPLPDPARYMELNAHTP
jgi:GNAT superfamily N-acetyltransferase